MAVKLSKRLSALAELVTPGNRLADVGTDHGYIPVFLCQTEVIPSAIAMDINEGPLQRAGSHIAEYHLEDRIQTRLSDGLHKLLPGEADTILIAGMGGGLMQRILSEGGQALDGVSELILQPQSEIPGMRRFLRNHGFLIVDENMIEEDGKFYPMMKVHRLDERMHDSGGSIQKSDKKIRVNDEVRKSDEIFPALRMQELEDQFGPVLLKNRNPVLLIWLKRELSITDGIFLRLTEQLGKCPDNEKLILRRQEISEKKKLLLEALQLMKKEVV